MGHKLVEACPQGCVGEGAGADDVCNGGGPTCSAAEKTNQALGDASFWTCEGQARYVCDQKGLKISQPCAHGCVGEGAGKDDQCN
jgi:hypothetical protein